MQSSIFFIYVFSNRLFFYSQLSFLGSILTLESRVRVTGLPPTGSWQDLKDHMREAGDVCYSDVFKDGSGAVEYMRYEDMKYALKKLDDSRFKSHEVSLSCV